MTKSIAPKEPTVKTTFELPESIHNQVIQRVSKRMGTEKITITKTDVLVELVKIGLQKVK